ncbi:MAG: crossover junction endodeoxyribonuclease RuvC [Christensenellaceae bacterium]|jgi:crossover junction endodeoxyribonuclease RuvC|nr:crossover junction endodeoxyribonuclease RuvC [Christensenellaceae bacterium]
MIILGIDPGYGTLGYGVIKKERGVCAHIENGAIITPKTDRFPERLKFIAEKIEELLAKYSPDAVAIEELFFNTNQKTAIMVAEARGVVLVTVERASIPLFEYTPIQIKLSLTGYGRADKNQIQQMVKMVLHLPEIPKPDDAADALACALTHAQTNTKML